MRRRIYVGLNKGEARNALARDVFFYRLGELRDRTHENQRPRASGLNLVVTSIVLWNTAKGSRAKGSPISAHRQTIKRLRPQIFFFRCFSLGPRPLCGWYSILLNRSLNLDLHALAWAIRSVTHLVLACFVSWRFAPFSSTRCSRTTSYAQPRFTTGSRKSSVPSGVHSVRRALVRVGPTGLSRPTLCRLTVRSNRRKNILVRRCSPVASGTHPQVCHWLSSNPLRCVLRDLRLARAACSSRLALISFYSSKADLLFLVLLSLLPLAAHRRDVVVGKQAPPISSLDLVQPLCWLTPALPKSLQPSVR